MVRLWTTAERGAWPRRRRRDQSRNLYRRRPTPPASISCASISTQAADPARSASWPRPPSWTSTARPGPAAPPCWCTRPASTSACAASRYFVDRGTPLEGRFHRHRPGRQARRRPPGGGRAPRGWNGNTAPDTGRKKKPTSQTCSHGLRRTNRSPAPSRRRSAAPTASPPPSPTSRAAATRASSPAGSAAASSPPARKVEQEEVTLIPDKETYQPGDMAADPGAVALQPGRGPADRQPQRDRLHPALPDHRWHRHPRNPDRGSLHPQPEHPGGSERVGPAHGRPGQPIQACAARPAFATGIAQPAHPARQPHASVAIEPEATELAPGGTRHRPRRHRRARRAGRGRRTGRRRRRRSRPRAHRLLDCRPVATFYRRRAGIDLAELRRPR